MEDEKLKWRGVPFRFRYSQSASASNVLVKAIRKIDDLLDLKFYIPTEKWHLVRFYHGRNSPEFTRVWELDDKPELGLRRHPGFWIVDALKAGDMHNAAKDRESEVDEKNDQIEASVDRELEAQCNDFANDIRKPMQRLYDYGPSAGHKEHF